MENWMRETAAISMNLIYFNSGLISFMMIIRSARNIVYVKNIKW